MAVQFRDYYETLGVSKTATEDEIRSAFRKLARKYHPDVAKDKKAAEEKFKQINEAYEVLSDPEKRKKYDQLGADWNQPGGFQPPPQWGGQPGGGFYQFGGDGGGVQFEFGGTGFSDFFEAFFGGGRGRSAFGGFGGREATAERGADVEAGILVTLEESLHGSPRALSFTRTRPARYFRKKRRPLRCGANKHSEKIVGTRTRDLESTGEDARELTCFCDSDRSGGISRYFSQFTSIGPEIMRDVSTSIDRTGLVILDTDS